MSEQTNQLVEALEEHAIATNDYDVIAAESIAEGVLKSSWIAERDAKIRAEEREKCAQIALSTQLGTHWTASNGLTLAMSVMRDIADRIRGRGGASK